MNSPELATIANLETMCVEKSLVDAHFVKRNQGGYTAHLLGYEAFMPGSHSLVPNSVSTEQDPLLDTTAPVVIIEVRTAPFKLVVSRRDAKPALAALALAEKESHRLQKEAFAAELRIRRAEELSQLTVGDIVEATAIYNKFGVAFFQAGSLEISVPKSELSWGDSGFPIVGKVHPCVITALDVEQQTLAGSLRQVQPDPWIDIAERYLPNVQLIARVKKNVAFGVFLELQPGVDCLLHRSAFPDADPTIDFSQYFSPSDQVPITITSLDLSLRRVSAAPLLTTLAQWAYLRASQGQLNNAQQRIIELTSQLEHYIHQLSEAEVAAQQQQVNQTLVHQQSLAQYQQQSAQVVAEKDTLIDKLTGHNKILYRDVVRLESELAQLQTKYRTQGSEVATVEAQRRLADERYQQQLIKFQTLQKENEILTTNLQTHQRKAAVFEQEFLKLKQASESNEKTIPTESATLAPSSIPALITEKVNNSTTVYITLSNLKQLVSAYDLSNENIPGKIFLVSFPHYNKLEEKQLLAFQQLCQFPELYLSSAANRVRVAKGNLLFANTPPAFHRLPNCQFALSDYVNYEVPDEIKKAGKQKEMEFREWWAKRLEENPNYRDNSTLMDSLLTRCQIQFKLETKPRRFTAPNGGLRSLTDQNVFNLEVQIKKLIADAAAYVNSTSNHKIILNLYGKHAYKGNNINFEIDNPTSLPTAEVQAILRRYENDYKKILISLLQTYYLSKYNNSLSFDHTLLIALGFRPCHGCFGPHAAKTLRQITTSSPPPRIEDDDLPF
jgi:ribosomal protein S1